MLQVIEVARATGGLLHRPEVLERAEAQWKLEDGRVDRRLRKMVVGELSRDARDPLHHVQCAEARLESEVPALREVLRVGRFERELGRVEVADADLLRVEFGERLREARPVSMDGAGQMSMSLVALGQPWKPTARPPRITNSIWASSSAASRSRGLSAGTAPRLRDLADELREDERVGGSVLGRPRVLRCRPRFICCRIALGVVSEPSLVRATSHLVNGTGAPERQCFDVPAGAAAVK